MTHAWYSVYGIRAEGVLKIPLILIDECWLRNVVIWAGTRVTFGLTLRGEEGVKRQQRLLVGALPSLSLRNMEELYYCHTIRPMHNCPAQNIT